VINGDFLAAFPLIMKSPLLTIFLSLCFAGAGAYGQSETSSIALKKSGDAKIAIPNSAFGQEYMLSTSLIPQAGAVTGRGLLGRIVMFEKYHDSVDMYESTKGQVVTEDLPARRLLATFPILSEEGGSAVIDFNQGMRRLLYQGWYAMSSRYDPAALERTAELPQARVFEVFEDGDNLVVRQTVQARNREVNQNRETRLELRYFIKPYTESGFEGKESNPVETRYARFFETQRQLELTSGRQSVKMGRFDDSEPIVFHYSANTPSEYEDAVKEGILYWNRAFGKELVQAEKAPEGVTAPDVQRNVIQWVPWDSAGFAYADALLDPRTGQTLHGQAFMTSVFGISGKARARALIRSMAEIVEDAEDSDTDGEEEGAFSLFGIHSACRIDPVEFAMQLSQGLEELLADPDLTDEAVLKLSQDYVREVTAHEVGHVLGLRHNFAGSLDADMSPKELDAFIKDYIAGNDLEKYANRTTSSSSMEYTEFKAAVFIGWKMKTQGAPLEHDKGAVRWGYFDDKEVVEERMLFGSDEDVSTFGDIQRFDYGADPIFAMYQEISSQLRFLPNSVIERFIQARAPRDARDREPLETVNLSVRRYASRLASAYGGMLSWFRSETRSRRVENDFDFIGDLNEEERVKAHWEYLNQQLDSLGGVDRVLFSYLPLDFKLDLKYELEGVEIAPKIDAKEMAKRLKDLLDTENYATFVGLDEETYAWTEEEKSIISDRGSMLFSELEEAVIVEILKRYEEAPRDLGLKATGALSDDDAVAQMEKRIIELAKEVLVKKNNDARIRGKVDKALVEVVDFQYEHDTRVAAAKALNDKAGSYPAWAKEAKEKLHEELKKSVDEALNIGHFKNFEDDMLSRSLREWYLKQQDILKLLPPAKKAPSNGKEG